MEQLRMPPPLPPARKKQAFIVDTKTTCFLCLQEAISPEVSSTSVGSLFHLEQNDEDQVPENPQENRTDRPAKKRKREPFCLRRVFKLLHLNPGQVLSEKLAAGPFLGSNMMNVDFSVVLCEKCLQVSSHLSSLFTEWELLQMKMDQAIQNFGQILVDSEGDPQYMAQLRNKSQDPLELLQTSIAEVIRKETVEKCREHLLESLPRVTLSKKDCSTVSDGPGTTFPGRVISPFHLTSKIRCRDVETVAAGPPQKLSPKFSKHICKGCRKHFSRRGTLHKHQELHCTFRPGRSTPNLVSKSNGTVNGTSFTAASSTSTSAVYEKDKESNIGQLPCPICGVSHRFISQHLRRRHKDLLSSRKVQKFLHDYVPYPCPNCGRRFQLLTSRDRHQKKVCKFRLCDTSTPTLPATTTPVVSVEDLIKDMPRIKREGDDQEDLLLCGLCPSQSDSEKFTEEDKLKEHIFMSHPDQFFAFSKHPQCSESRFREFCSKLLATEVAGSSCRVQRNSECETGYNCGHCPAQLQTKWAISNHLVQDHSSLFGSKLIELQRPKSGTSSSNIKRSGLPRKPETEETVVGTSANASLSGAAPSTFVSATQRRRSPYYTHTCNSCGKTFTKLKYMISHQALHCPHLHGVNKEFQLTANSSIPVREKPHHTFCKDCGRYLHQLSLTRHNNLTCPYRKHKGHPSSLYQCQGSSCQVEFPSHGILREHIVSFHLTKGKRKPEAAGGGDTTGTKYCCKYCGRIHSRKNALNKHVTQSCKIAKAATAAPSTSGQGERSPALEVGTDQPDTFEEEDHTVEVTEVSSIPVVDLLLPVPQLCLVKSDAEMGSQGTGSEHGGGGLNTEISLQELDPFTGKEESSPPVMLPDNEDFLYF